MMTSRAPRPRVGLCCAVLLLASASSALGGDRSQRPLPLTEPAPAPAGAPALGVDEARVLALSAGEPRVWFDEPGDGALWARGRHWKMSFDGFGATYIASFGPHLPSQELRFTPERVTLGGAPLAFERGARVRRSAECVELERGSFVEAYRLAHDSVEQLFVFHELPRRGELVLELSVAGEHQSQVRETGLEFHGVHGSVRYSPAFALDASGRKVDARTELGPQGLRITVDAEFVAAAQLPLIIDPFLGQDWLDSTTTDTREPDAVWDSFNGVWLAVYHEVFSATDNDVRVRVISSSGQLWQDGYIDFTSSTWSNPRIAYLRADTRCLVVAEVNGPGLRIVRGRTVKPNGTILEFGSQFTISGSHTGEKFAPTVGGDPYPSQPAYFCVAFQREIPGSAITHEIHYALVTAGGSIHIAATPIPAAGGFRDASPSLSKSNGAVQWTLAFSRQDPVTHGDIYAVYIGWAGGLGTAFGISAFGIARDALPCASSPLNDPSVSAVAFERRNGIAAQPDVIVSLIQNGTVLDSVNTSVMENSGALSVAQFAPSIDSDGLRFMLAYSEFVPAFSYDELKLSEYFVSGGKLAIAQAYEDVFSLGLSYRVSKVAASNTNPSGPNRFLIVSHLRQNDTDYDISASRWESTVGGTATAYCFGDGSGTPCPCGNQGAPGHGCGNSNVSDGARLGASGLFSIAAGDTVLTVDFMTATQPCLIFQGTSALSGTVFGEGLRCAGGFNTRLAIRTSDVGGSVSFPGPGDPTLAAQGAVPAEGAMRTYQVWYRDPTSFCNSSNYNLSNGVRIQWAP